MNDYFNPSNAPATSSSLSSATMRAEFAAVGQGMDKLPALTGNANEVVVVNAGATGLASTPAATLVASTITAATGKATPVDADELPLADSAASFALKKLTWVNLKAAVKSYYDAAASTLTNKTIALGSNTVSGTTAQFNAALTDNDFATLAGIETLTNKTINLSSNTLAATSAQLAAALTDETGTGSAVFANSPTLVTPALGTPSALIGTNITGTAAGLTAGNVTTNANLTGHVTSVGNAAVLGSFTSAQLATALTDETGTGAAVFAGSPALTGTPTAPTAAADTNTTQLATTAHVFAERSNTATLTNKAISGGTIDGAPIGSTTPAAASFTTLTQVNRISANFTIPDGHNALTVCPFEVGPDVTVTGLGNATWRGL